MYKILFLILLLAQFAYNLVLKLLSDRQIGKAQIFPIAMGEEFVDQKAVVADGAGVDRFGAA